VFGGGGGVVGRSLGGGVRGRICFLFIHDEGHIRFLSYKILCCYLIIFFRFETNTLLNLGAGGRGGCGVGGLGVGGVWT